MNKFFTAFFCALVMLSVGGSGFASMPDARDYFDHYNIVWDTPSRSSAESMPLGGGEMGANVWVENGDLLFYAQQSGAFDRNGEDLKLGRFRIHLSPNPFGDGASFKQELKLREGYIQITAETPASGKVTLNLWIEVGRPVLHVDVAGEHLIALTASYESWRHHDVPLPPEERPAAGRRSSIFDFDGYQVTLTKPADVIEPGRQAIIWYQDNGTAFNAFDFAVTNEGLDAIKPTLWDPLRHLVSGGMMRGENLEFAGTSDGTYFSTPYRAWHFRATQPAQEHHLEITGLVEKADTAAAWKEKLSRQVNEKTDRAQRWRQNVAWWNAFWNRSYVIINPGRDATDNGWRVGRNYNLFRYQLGGNVSGQAPTKFNGGNLTFDSGHVNADYNFGPDYRRWGGWSYTAANQQLVYWAYLRSGDFEAMRPQFDVYRDGLVNAVARTRAHWGHDGCSFAEQFQHSGLPLASHYGFAEHGFSFFIRPKDFEKGEMANPWISTLYAGQLDFAYMILEYQRYSRADISSYIPFVLSCLRFYDEHYQMIHRQATGQSLDANGRLVIFPSTPGEHHLNSTNPADAVAGLIAITDSLLALPAKILSEEQRAYVAGFQKRIPELPTEMAMIDGRAQMFFKASQADGGDGSSHHAGMYALFPFNVVNLGSDRIGSMLQTWKLRAEPRQQKGYVGWENAVILAARLGQAKDAREIIARKLEDSARLTRNEMNNANRFPTFWGPGYDWTPDHNWGGSGMIGLQDMILQSYDDKIYLLPAWPKDWDVHFKLHAPGNTTVEGSFMGGKLVQVTVTPKERVKDLVLPAGNGSVP